MRTIITACVLLVLCASILSAQWERIDDNFGIQGPHQPSVAVADASFLYQLMILGPPYEVHLYRTSDDGTTWSRMSAFPSTLILPNYIRILANGRIVAGSPDGASTNAVILYSDDQAISWHEVRTSAGVDVRTMELCGDHTYVAGVREGKMIRSEDDGQTWHVLPGSPTSVDQIRVVDTSIIAFSASDGMVRRSSDGGNSWSDVIYDEGLPGNQNTASSIWKVGGTVFLKQDGPVTGAYMSIDGGVTWTYFYDLQNDDDRFVETSPDGKKWILYGGLWVGLTKDIEREPMHDITYLGLPHEEAGAICAGDFALTDVAVHFAAVCHFPPGGSGLYRYFFPKASAVERAAGRTDTLDLRLIPGDGTWRIEFTLPSAADVRITVHDQNGRCVATVLDGDYDAGSHVTRFDADILPAGVYWVRAESDGASVTRKMVVVN